MSEIRDFGAEAFNEVPNSENAIHGDEVARQYGFTGGLVPGVTVSAYLAHPAVTAWGGDYLALGHAHITVTKPLYDGVRFEVKIEERGDAWYRAALFDAAGTRCAEGRFHIPPVLPPAPPRRGDRNVPPAHERPYASRQTLERLRAEGLGAVHARWNEQAPITTYLRDPRQLPELLRPGAGGCASQAFVLGLTNWALAANVQLGPWLHLETDSQHYAAIAYGSEVIVESQIVELFERKGHQFVDLDCAAFLADGAPAMCTRLRAIYQLRAPT